MIYNVYVKLYFAIVVAFVARNKTKIFDGCKSDFLNSEIKIPTSGINKISW